MDFTQAIKMFKKSNVRLYHHNFKFFHENIIVVCIFYAILCHRAPLKIRKLLSTILYISASAQKIKILFAKQQIGSATAPFIFNSLSPEFAPFPIFVGEIVKKKLAIHFVNIHTKFRNHDVMVCKNDLGREGKYAAQETIRFGKGEGSLQLHKEQRKKLRKDSS